MGSRIATLSTEVVNLIAAGEVIDSLAAIVRELAENALDAGATRIVISLFPDQWRIRVADNGLGMSLADLQQAATPHSTSKISDRQDLSRITSLGFRGEALHSLAQVAALDIISRAEDAAEGWQVTYHPGGQPDRLHPVAVAPGTIVTVSQIFAHWVARRQALPPIAQQLRAIQATVYRLALCHPQVTWQVQQDDRQWLNLWASKTPRQLLPQMLRDVQPGDLQEATLSSAAADAPFVGRSAAPTSLYLLLGLPDRCHRHRPDWMRIALNGRCVQMPEFEQTILNQFRRTLPRDRFPICFVHLQVPPEQIDWNRQPDKSTVYLHHLEAWRAQVATAIDQTLQLGAAQLPESLYTTRVSNLIKTAETAAGYHLDRTPEALSASTQAPIPNPLKAIAQLHNRYILAEHPTGVWLVEQHIAHERVLFEQICDHWQLVPLATAIVLNHLTTSQVEQLQRIGLVLELFGDQTWLVRTAPALLADRSDCAEALVELSLGGDLQTAQVATACRSAIRNGTPLPREDMQTLLDQWQQTRHPRTCPHGRPICLTLEESTLSRFFRRHWVIGKSHGI